MRSKEGENIQSVASRIAQFELNSSETSCPVDDDNMTIQKNKNNRMTPVSFGQRYLDLDDIIEESSIEDDCDNNDSDGYLAASNEDTSSPDTSFRLSGRSSSSGSEHSVSVNQISSERSVSITKSNISEKLSQKSLDSGFSDYSDSTKDQSIDNCSDRRLKSSVVHETHANKDSSKFHHVSKVYFYSVSDILQDSSTEYEDHLTLLKNESASHHSNPTTPRISSSICDEEYFDRVESPFVPIASPSSRDSPFQRCPRVHTGTSSLRRKTTKEDDTSKNSYLYSSESPSQSPVRRCHTPSQSPFPITNGCLYSELSLNRRNKDQQNRKLKSDIYPSNEYESQNSMSPFPSLCTSLPLENYGLDISINSIKDLPISGPVGSWLSELKNVHESECTIMLQSKPVRKSDAENDKDGITDIKEKIKIIQDRAHLLSGLFANMCREVAECSKPRLVSQIHNLTHQIQLFFLECQNQQCGVMDYSHFPGYARNKTTERTLTLAEIKHEQEKLLYLCDSIKLTVTRESQKVPLIKLITLIGSTFSRVVELMLGVQIKTCVDRVAGSDLGVSLSVMTSLALEGNNLCRLLVKHGAVERLLSLCTDSDTKLEIRISGLRALGSICCVLEGIIRFKELNGSGLVVKILADKNRGEEERREAAGVLAQVMSPWIEGNTGIEEMDNNLADIVISLKDLIMMSNSLETFLLCSAALANLTSMSSLSLTCVSSSSLLHILLSHSASSSSSVYILEQLVTIVVNMAKLPVSRKQMVQSKVLKFLFNIFNLSDCEKEESVIKAATERTVSKAAIALARLCLDPVTADTVVNMGGLEKLFPLAESNKKCNETIRIAAMAAIKTISVYSSITDQINRKNIQFSSNSSDYYTSEIPTSSLESFV